ncbi:MAG: hypothetical protein JSU89_13145 [Myxococcales bacterium]|nr:MAG: hypothetical protein JSU89_13145 [Myxococcales bacterium]
MGSRFGPQGASFRFALGFLLISGTVSTGCANKAGEDLPAGLMSFPIAIELSTDQDADGNPKYAYVTSSNFGLQYNSGNVQSYDLQKVVEAIGTGCVERWVLQDCLDSGNTDDPACDCDRLTDPDCVPVPQGIEERCLEDDFEGDINDPACDCDVLTDDACVAIPFDRCSVVPASLIFRDQGAALRLIRVPGLLRGEVGIGSFSDGLGVATDGRRLYVPVRSDANLTFIDVNDEGQLSCGGEFGQRHTCTGPYRSGSAEQVNPSVSLSLPPDPVDVYVGDLAADFAPPSDPTDPAFRGDYILMAHREGRASMFFDQLRPGGPAPQNRPRLAATLDDLAPEQVTITYEPGAKRAWIPSALSRAVVRVGIGIDGDPTQSYLFDAGTLFVSGLDDGSNNRDIRFDPRPGRDLAYIVSRSPEALVVARSNVAGGDLNMVGQISTCRDPSRLQIAEVPVPGRGTVLLAFVSCFLARSVQVIDADKFQGVTLLTNISGAFEFVIDGPRLLMYTADFSTSVLRVADLTPLAACLQSGMDGPEECSPRLLGLVGLPQPVSELPR